MHGSEKADAKVIIHGYYAFPKDANIPYMDVLLKYNLKEINISMPGVGLSELADDLYHDVGKWPETDVEPVLKAENITEPFFVYGGSK